MRRVVFGGKGGIGKSTVASNTAVILTNGGQRVLQVGCDPKHDSCSSHLSEPIETLMDAFSKRRHLDAEGFNDLVVEGHDGVFCVEAGGPRPGMGCSGRGISLLVDIMTDAMMISGDWDFQIFDLLGDVVCGGFAAPIRLGPDTEIYLVVSGEPLPIYAANNIAHGVVNLAARGAGRVAGVIANSRNTLGEVELITDFAQALGTRVVAWIPRDERVFLAELENQNVANAFPDSAAGVALQGLADTIMATSKDDLVVPTPLSEEALRALYRRHLGKVLSA